MIPTVEYEFETGLSWLGLVIESVTGYNPMVNSGASYKNETFEVNAYYWGDDEILMERPNFKYKDFEARWYKYCGRSMEVSRKITLKEFVEIITTCIASVKK